MHKLDSSFYERSTFSHVAFDIKKITDLKSSFAQNLKIGVIGIGSCSTWHGEADARIWEFNDFEVDVVTSGDQPQSTMPALHRESSASLDSCSIHFEAER